MCFVKINFKNEKVLKSKIMPAILFEPVRSISFDQGNLGSLMMADRPWTSGRVMILVIYLVTISETRAVINTCQKLSGTL